MLHAIIHVHHMQAQFLPNVNPANPGKMVNFIADPSMTSRFRDQFAPYAAFGLNWSQPFPGTVFRFPLRTAAQAANSMLSKKVVSAVELSHLLEALRKEASAMLLFLKTVECIEILSWEASASEPVITFSADIANPTSEIRSKRLFVGNAIRQTNAAAAYEPGRPSAPSLTDAHVDFRLDIRCHHIENSGMRYPIFEHWEVCNQLGGPVANEISVAPGNAFLRLVPWAGVAACVNVNSSENEIKSGLAYCFLPLPVRTGLPIMVNGFFELSSNRRDVWQAGPDMTGDGKTRAAWNMALMTDVISPSYCRLLLRLRDALGFSDKYQQFWPSESLSHPWRLVVESTLVCCRPERLLYRQSIFPCVLNGPPGGSAWIPCFEAVLLPGGIQKLNDADEESLSEVLVAANCPFVKCATPLRDLLIKTRTCNGVSDSSYVRQILRQFINADPTSENFHRYIPPKRLCGFLLRYCTAELSLSQPSDLLELDCLNILPLLTLPSLKQSTDSGILGKSVAVIRIYSQSQLVAADSLVAMGFSYSAAHGSLARNAYNVEAAMETLMDSSAFSNGNNESSVYVLCSNGDEMQLFSAAEGILVDRSCVNPNELELLADSRLQRVSNVKKFEPSLTCDILRAILPKECFDPRHVNGGVLLLSEHSNGMTTEALLKFVENFWGFCKSHPKIISAIAEGVNIVPTRSGQLLPLSRLSFILSSNGMSDRVQSVLEQIGLNILNTNVIPDAASMPATFWDYIYPASRGGLVQVLQSALGGAALDRFRDVSAEGRIELLSYICSCESIRSLAGQA